MSNDLPCSGIDEKLPRDVMKQAFANGLVVDGQVWIGMLEDRNLMARAYGVRTLILPSAAPLIAPRSCVRRLTACPLHTCSTRPTTRAFGTKV